MRSTVWIALMVGLALTTADAARGAASHPTPPTGGVGPNPAVVQGVLPNGLRYLIMSNPRPAHAISLRLGVLAGSLDETDDEGGAAHFVEHLAYSGLGGVAEAELERTFADQGVALGRDRNAETTYRSTTYRIDLSRTEGLDLGLRWLRHVADGGHFDDTAVSAERRVILAEREARLNATHSAGVAAVGFELAGLRVGAREPIGTPQSLAAMTAQKLNDFYRRWYRPRNAVLVIVGDAPAERLRAALIRTFASWADDGPAPVRPLSGEVDERRGLDVLTLERPRQLLQAEVCRVRNAPVPEPDEAGALSAQIRTVLWSDILQGRLARIAEDATSAIAAARVDSEVPDHWPARRICIEGTPSAEGWEPMLARLRAEIDRFGATGPTDDEMRSAIAERGARFRGAVMQASTRTSDTIATALLMNGLNRRTSPSPVEAERRFDALTEALRPADLRAAFQADWAGAGPLIVLLSPTAEDGASVAATWTRAEAGTGSRPAAPPPMVAAWR